MVLKSYVLLISVIFAAGCAAQYSQPATTSAPTTTASAALCGNNVVDAGEECDGLKGSCSSGKVCSPNTCKCETLPALPKIPE